MNPQTARPIGAEDVRRLFHRRFGDSEGIVVARAPGRVNLLGEHTDYNGGFVLPTTLDRAVWLALRPRADATVDIHSASFDQSIRYHLAERPRLPPAAWSSYVTGAIEELYRLGLMKHGVEGVISGDVPLGAGLSSSAALTVATVVSLQQALGFELNPLATVKLCQAVEHRYVGVNCGIMDQFAARLGRAGHALFLDCRSLEHQDIPLDLDGYRIVLVHTGVKRELAGSKYNQRRAECEQAVALLGRYDSAIEALRDVSPELLYRHADELPPTVLQRARHVVNENQRVLKARTLLVEQRLPEFGTLMSQSHASLRDDYAVSCKELDALVEIGQTSPGVLGSRMTGAGFGGCTVHWVERAAVEQFRKRVAASYPPMFGLEPTVLPLEHNVEAGPVS